VTPSKTEQALSRIHSFCEKPWRQHGKKRTSGPHKGWYEHDWGDLVQNLSYLFLGSVQSIPRAAEIARSIRRMFPDNSSWDEAVKRPGADERILNTVLGSLGVSTNDSSAALATSLGSPQTTRNASLSLTGAASFTAVCKVVVSTIRTMAQDAIANGMPYGLRGLPEWRGKPPNQWETGINEDLESRLAASFRVVVDKSYPLDATMRISELCDCRGKTRNYCDLKLDLIQDGKFWIETKSIFECVLGADPTGHYVKDYSGQNHTTRNACTNVSIREADIDAKKLGCLRLPEATHLGLLILGFDRVGYELETVDGFNALVRSLCNSGWDVLHETWPDCHAPRAAIGFRDRVWFWHRPSEAVKPCNPS